MIGAAQQVMRRIAHLVRRALTVGNAVENGTIQKLQVQFSHWESVVDVLSVSHYGFVSVPVIGCDTVILASKGDNSQAIAIATNDVRYRMQSLSPGEVAIHDSTGQYIHIVVASGKIIIKANTEIDVTAPTVAITGNLTVTGTIVAQGEITSGSIHLTSHAHGGVQTGSGNTAGPH
jgi:phage baseplate assembly protein V